MHNANLMKEMKKISIILFFGVFLLLVPTISRAEETPAADSVATNTEFLKVDAKELEKFAKDTKRFDAQLQRLIDGDTTLTDEEVRDIYFGFSYTDKYSAFGDKCFKADEELDKNNTKKALELYEKQLEKSPVCASLLLRVMSIYFFLEGKDSENAQRINLRLKLIAHMLQRTGDGVTMETAYKVNWVADEYFILKTFGCKRFLEQQIAQGNSAIGDKFKVEIDGKIYDFYFDLTRYFVKMNDMLK